MHIQTVIIGIKHKLHKIKNIIRPILSSENKRTANKSLINCKGSKMIGDVNLSVKWCLTRDKNRRDERSQIRSKAIKIALCK